MSVCRAAVPGAKVEAVYVDLADLATIRVFASKALDGGRPLDVLVNNAGKCMSMRRYLHKYLLMHPSVPFIVNNGREVQALHA